MLPSNHPQRNELHDEVHARPPESMVAPLRISFLALLSNPGLREQEWQHVADLAARYGIEPPRKGANHFSADFGPFRMKSERHTEFTRYKIMVKGAAEEPFANFAISALPADWVAAIPGQVIFAAHVALVSAPDILPDYESIALRSFDGNVLAGAMIAGGAATALTDFRIHGDGFSRILVLDRELTPRQAGRMVQRLLELETYRIMALLALPVAQAVTPLLTRSEQELADITTALAGTNAHNEPALLDRLTRLEAEIGSRESENHYRFSAAAAYYELVQRRIDELREDRIQGLQNFREFTERRLAPAMNTCMAAVARQESLSQRVARATQLLSTRVDIARERQNQQVLEAMNRRAALQLRLQSTVEGLSLAAVTYYIVGVVSYAAKAAKAAGLPVNADLVTGVSIPFIALLVFLGVRKVHRMVNDAGD
jgi:uncharacterized membrane-anchored protein